MGDKRFGTETLEDDFLNDYSSTLWQKDDPDIGLLLSLFSAHLCESVNLDSSDCLGGCTLNHILVQTRVLHLV